MKNLLWLVVALFALSVLPMGAYNTVAEQDKAESVQENAQNTEQQVKQDDEEEEEEESENRAFNISPGQLITAMNSLLFGENAFAEEPEGKAEEKKGPEDADVKSLKKALGQFYVALNTLFRGDARQMKGVWSHADDVTYMPPDGTYLVGWEDVEKSWEAQADLELGGVIKPVEINYNIGETIAVVHNYEVGENFVDGKQTEVKIRVTNLFRKEGGKWKMIGHHTDILPFLVKDLDKAN